MEQRVLSSESIAEDSATIIFQYIQKALNHRSEFNLALSGGESPIKLYELLARKLNVLENLKINVFQVDERYVEQNHKDSNQLMIKKSFLNLLENKNKINYYFYNTVLPIADATYAYDQLLEDYVMDLAVMGVGMDGHTASLFPNDKYMQIPSDKKVIFTKEHNGYSRLTMTLSPLLRSRQLIFYVPGVAKRKIVEKILDVKNSNCLPSSYLLHKHPNAIIMWEK